MSPLYVRGVRDRLWISSGGSKSDGVRDGERRSIFRTEPGPCCWIVRERRLIRSSRCPEDERRSRLSSLLSSALYRMKTKTNNTISGTCVLCRPNLIMWRTTLDREGRP